MKYTLYALLLMFVMAGCDQQGTAVDERAPDADFKAVVNVGDDHVIQLIQDINEKLATMEIAGMAKTHSGYSLAVESIDFFTIGNGRPSNRIHQGTTRWVASDPSRLADGDNMTYIVDQSNQGTTSGVSAADTEAAIDRSMQTWDAERSMRKVNIVKRADPGTDVSIFDEFVASGFFDDLPDPGNPFAADIVNVGWYPRAYFEAVGGPGGGRGILAFSVSFIFVDGNGNPADVNGDNYIDRALNEVYYNDTFGDPGDDRVGNPWGLDTALPGIDVETVALHENGHSLLLGHFGPPPSAVMNPVYAGINHSPDAADHAGMSTVWNRWPN